MMHSEHENPVNTAGTASLGRASGSKLKPSELDGFLQRLAYALGPLGTGIILDLLDLASIGPVGMVLGTLVGGAAGWFLGKYEGFENGLRVAFALCCAAYMALPGTELIPAATILLLLLRYFNGPRTLSASPGDHVGATPTAHSPYEPTVGTRKD